MKRVLVTGGAGFIGSHIVEELLNKGHHVAVLDNLSHGLKANIPVDVALYEMDVTSPRVSQVLAQERPDIVIHQAAQVSVSASVKDPRFDATVNIMGTVNVLQECVTHEVKKFIFASSAAVYGVPEFLPIPETHPLKPISPYGLSKYTSERYIQMICEFGGLQYAILRYANVFGPRQDPRGEAGVVSIFAERLRQGQQPQIFGHGEQTRDFIYVKDVARANVAAIEASGNSTFNIGSGGSVSINDLFLTMRSITGTSTAARYASPRIGDIQDSLLDNSLAKSTLQLSPMYSLHNGLAEMLSWNEQVAPTIEHTRM